MEEDDDSELRGRAGPGGRLDMSHGFVHHIRRNQIARDDYDREVKKAQQKQKKRYVPGPPRPKKPDLQVYCPRPRGDARPACGLEDDESSDSNNGTDPENTGSKLFCLEFEADGGHITSVIVYEIYHFCQAWPWGKALLRVHKAQNNNRRKLQRYDDAEQVATKISAENHLEHRMKEALRQRIQEEISKRRVQR
uniref:Chromosome 2 open reading frame 68 n=1 Tax=Leptobrachium leishanense TaxID=445787 RepID=A0A8C5P9V6_9ANUR